MSATPTPLGSLAEVRTYVHDGCLVSSSAAVHVVAGRLSCTGCGAWWEKPTIGAPPTGTSASDPGPTKPTPQRRRKK